MLLYLIQAADLAAVGTFAYKAGPIRLVSLVPLNGRALTLSRLSLAWCGLLLAGCASPFSANAAREVSRERLVEIADSGPVDHLRYVGSDLSYHYVNDVRPGRKRTYKIRADQVALRETFSLGEGSYPLYPWVIEGKPFGTRTQADWPGEAERSPLRGPPQPIVDGPAKP